ncbi:MAG: nitrogen fixation protein NifZ [Candidatus Competibacteraceae bacterium]
MRPRFEQGDVVRVIRTIRNDGTYPGLPRGALLIERGSLGYVRTLGTFLQDQIIYGVHFLQDNRLVGCREQELIAADTPWVHNRFEVRDQVVARLALTLHGEVIVAQGEPGVIMRVIHDASGDVLYHVQFHDRLLQTPESALKVAPD